MNNTNNTNDLVEYSFYNIGIGTYNAYFDGSDMCYLFSSNLKNLKYKLNKNDSYFIHKHIKDLKCEIIKISNQYYCNYNIILISEEKYYCNKKHDHRCDDEHKYKEIYIKINNEKPISIYKENIISELKIRDRYNISDFLEISDHSGIITSNGYKYYVNNKVISILKKYFKYEDEKIICMYNNKKEIAKLTLITEDKFDNIILQRLKLEIDNKNFSFYINRYKNFRFNTNVDNNKFLIFHIYNNLILGYEYSEDIYYHLTFFKNSSLTYKIILDNINQKIAEKFRKRENIDIYTYVSINNKYYGLLHTNIINDNIRSKTYKLLELDEVFKTILDISLLKPVNEWDDEEINAKKKYYEKEYKDNIENNTNKDTKDNIEK